MKACVLVEPGRIEFRDVAAPRPRRGEVLVRVKAALTCGTDLKAFRRGHPMIPMPTVLGHEYAGIVEAVGEGVTAFQPGQAVMGVHSGPCNSCFFCLQGQPQLCESIMKTKALGAFAEFMLLPDTVVRQNLFIKPDSIPFEAAALLEPLSCVVHGVRLCGPLTPGGYAFVIGAGPIGLMFALRLKKAGMKVFVAGRRSARLEMARSLGADRVYDTDGAGNLKEWVHELTSGRGADVVIECTGQPPVWESSVSYVRRGGTVLLFGGCPPGTKVAFDTDRLHYDEITLKGGFHFSPSDVLESARWIEADFSELSRLITDRYPLSELPRSFERLGRGEGIKHAILP